MRRNLTHNKPDGLLCRGKGCIFTAILHGRSLWNKNRCTIAGISFPSTVESVGKSHCLRHCRDSNRGFYIFEVSIHIFKKVGDLSGYIIFSCSSYLGISLCPKKADYLELKWSDKMISFLSLFLIICFACAVVVFVEMGIIYLASILVGGINFKSSLSFVWATTLIILISEIVHLILRVTIKFFFKRIPNWLLELCILPVSIGIIYFIPLLFHSEVSLLAAFVITGIMFVTNCMLKEK
ncbi:hypothetical protein [Paenibacillus sp. 481]|uniref:hypothetical protein n=1 Tax=Paenibacillus sp. 481 TaxID=2835869 RepID=UPI001E303C6F|nr:hypothetical protein [Paenibacillus sp. 481]UHA72157.1 hypothetical protein KIK04_15790 [Paenibacillus sp. 481]